MSNKSFMTLSETECLQACQACLANSESKYNDAIALANNFSYGNASSQLIVSLEEMMKATILHFDANGFQFRRKVKGLGSIFQNHKLRYFLAFALPILNVSGQDLKALNYLILNSFGDYSGGDYSGAFRTENFSTPELLTRHLRIVDFFELRKKQKSSQKSIL